MKTVAAADDGDNSRRPDPYIRLIDADGNQLGVMRRSEARRRADANKLHLICVTRRTDPPVYRFRKEVSHG